MAKIQPSSVWVQYQEPRAKTRHTISSTSIPLSTYSIHPSLPISKRCWTPQANLDTLSQRWFLPPRTTLVSPLNEYKWVINRTLFKWALQISSGGHAAGHGVMEYWKLAQTILVLGYQRGAITWFICMTIFNLHQLFAHAFILTKWKLILLYSGNPLNPMIIFKLKIKKKTLWLSFYTFSGNSKLRHTWNIEFIELIV